VSDHYVEFGGNLNILLLNHGVIGGVVAGGRAGSSLKMSIEVQKEMGCNRSRTQELCKKKTF
jgi:hypothetical protein